MEVFSFIGVECNFLGNGRSITVGWYGGSNVHNVQKKLVRCNSAQGLGPGNHDYGRTTVLDTRLEGFFFSSPS